MLQLFMDIWQGYVSHLLEGKEVIFAYNHLTGDKNGKCNFEFSLGVDSCIGEIVAERIDTPTPLQQIQGTQVGVKRYLDYKDCDMTLYGITPRFRFVKIA